MFIISLCIFFFLAFGCNCMPINDLAFSPAPYWNLTESIIVMSNISEYESHIMNNSQISTSLLSTSSSPSSVYIKETGEMCSNSGRGEKQYCVKLVSQLTTFLDEIGAPLTACLDSRYGEGGSTSKGFSVEVDLSSGFNLNIASQAYTIFGFSGGVSVTTSISFSITDSCDVTKGNIVQLWGFPFYTSGYIKYRSFDIGRSGRKKNWSKWSDDQEATFATKISPATKCIGSVNEYVCGQIPVKRKFTVPGEPLIDKMS